MSFLKNPVLSLGSTILVTGANGLIGSHVVDQCLAYGYRVRGTVRDVTKNKWLQDHFDAKYGPRMLELVQVDDFAGPYDDAVKGVSGVAHVSFIHPDGADPNAIIQPTINGILEALRAAANEPSVKRFVLTSSASSVPALDPDAKGTLTADMWNEEVVKEAWSPPFTPEKAYAVYCASKVQGEQAMWYFMEEEKPHFVANSVVAPFILGSRISHEHQGHPSSTGIAAAFFHGIRQPMSRLNGVSPLYYSDSSDIGRFHLLGLIHPDLQNERVYPWAGTFNGNDILRAFRTLFPGKEFAPDTMGLKKCDNWTIEGRAKAETCLRDLGRPGFESFDSSMRGTAQGLGD